LGAPALAKAGRTDGDRGGNLSRLLLGSPLKFLDLEYERVFAWGCALSEQRHVDFDCAADAPP